LAGDGSTAQQRAAEPSGGGGKTEKEEKLKTPVRGFIEEATNSKTPRADGLAMLKR
jgi:hypothetical protein